MSKLSGVDTYLGPEMKSTGEDSASIRQRLRNKIFCTTTMFGAAIINALQNNEDDWTYSTLQEINN